MTLSTPVSTSDSGSGPLSYSPGPTRVQNESTASNALSVDVEDYFQVSNFDQLIPRDDWSALPSRVSDSTRRLLDLFDERAHRATFFSLGWVADRQPQLLREIADRGHEVACHGYGHELVYEIGPDRFRADLKRARRSIEDATGVQVTGYRAPSYSITHDSLWALDILCEEGFLYDSSIFPIRHHRYGIPEFSRVPVKVALPNGGRITEFPMTTLRVGPLNLPLAGGAYLRFLPGILFRGAFSRIVASARPTVLYVHPWEIDPDQPRQNVDLKVRVNHYYNLGRMAGKLGDLLKDHEFAPLSSVLDHLERTHRLPESSLHDLVNARPPIPDTGSQGDAPTISAGSAGTGAPPA